MNKDDLLKLISDEIQLVAFDYLKEKTLKEKTKSTDDYLNSRSLTDADVDHILFHGGAQQEKINLSDRIALKENAEPALKITTSEIKNFEKSFEDILQNIPGASIVFDKQKKQTDEEQVKEIVRKTIVNMYKFLWQKSNNYVREI